VKPFGQPWTLRFALWKHCWTRVLHVVHWPTKCALLLFTTCPAVIDTISLAALVCGHREHILCGLVTVGKCCYTVVPQAICSIAFSCWCHFHTHWINIQSRAQKVSYPAPTPANAGTRNLCWLNLRRRTLIHTWNKTSARLQIEVLLTIVTLWVKSKQSGGSRRVSLSQGKLAHGD